MNFIIYTKMITFSDQFVANKKRLETDSELRERIGKCPLCNHSIKDRTVSVYQGLIRSLFKVYQWCLENNCHEFETKQIKQFLGKNEYARFGDLIRFGGLVYKPEVDGKTRKALFGLNMERTKKFFAGEYKIPSQIVINQITGEVEAISWVTINDIPELKEFLDEIGLFDPNITIDHVAKRQARFTGYDN